MFFCKYVNLIFIPIIKYVLEKNYVIKFAVPHLSWKGPLDHFVFSDQVYYSGLRITQYNDDDIWKYECLFIVSHLSLPRKIYIFMERQLTEIIGVRSLSYLTVFVDDVFFKITRYNW